MLGSHFLYQWSRDHLNSIVSGGNTKILLSPHHIKAFKNVDRADFVPEEFREYAYSDQEIDIGFGQSLDKPTTIAQQIRHLAPKSGGKYLEIGMGTGYMAAILGEIVGEKGQVIALERILFLIDQARKNLDKYPKLNKIVNILFKDGRDGLMNESPYDGIVASVAYPGIPSELIKQLKLGARLVIPTDKDDIRVITKIEHEAWEEVVYPGFFFKQVQDGVE